jgi:hypothetical protein
MIIHKIHNQKYIKLLNAFNEGKNIGDLQIENPQGELVFIRPEDEIHVLNTIKLYSEYPLGLLPNKTHFHELIVQNKKTKILEFNHNVQNRTVLNCDLQSISPDASFQDTVTITGIKNPFIFQCQNIPKDKAITFYNCPNLTFPTQWIPPCDMELNNSGTGIIDLNSQHKLVVHNCPNVTEVKGGYLRFNLNKSPLKINAHIRMASIITFEDNNFPEIGNEAFLEDFTLVKAPHNQLHPEETIRLAQFFKQLGFEAKQKVITSLFKQRNIKAAIQIDPEHIEILLKVEDDPQKIQFLKQIQTVRKNINDQRDQIVQALTGIELSN